jgi:hypothetical protein
MIRDVAIRHLKLQLADLPAPSTERGVARHEIERWLNAINWHVAGYRPNQIWVIRRPLQLPRLIRHHEQAWVAAAEQMLAELFRRAVRVRLGIRGDWGNAESLLFEDRADWLALLTLDLLNGHLQKHWYWQATLAETPVGSAGTLLATNWENFAEYLPPSLALLSLAQVEQAVSLFSPAEVNRVVRALHQRFALPPTVLTVLRPEPTTAVIHVTAPWERWTASLSAALTPQAHYLIGLAQTLKHAPTYGGSQAFANAAAQWLEQALLAEQHGLVSQPTPRVAEPAHTAQVPLPAHRHAAPLPTVQQRCPLPSSTQQQRCPLPENHTSADTARVSPDQTASATHTGAGLMTELGGVLFLIHALHWLDLPEQHSAHISGWAWLEVVAHALLGHAPADPIWEVLRQLDEREPDAWLGAGWQPPEFRMTPRTVERYLSGPWRVAVRQQQLLLLRGDLLVREASIGSANHESALAAICEDYATQATPIRKNGDLFAPFPIPATLQRIASSGMIYWVERAMPTLIALLRRGLSDPELSVSAIAQRVLQHRGRLEITRTHIDLYLPLDTTDISLRRAGLDRNPGWMPLYGRIIQFHYGAAGEVER